MIRLVLLKGTDAELVVPSTMGLIVVVVYVLVVVVEELDVVDRVFVVVCVAVWVAVSLVG